VPTVTTGWLLRTWRQNVVGRAATDVATDLGVARSALSNWESDRRHPDISTVEKLDRLYGARGTLVDLLAALGTPAGFDPRRTWWHNYSPLGGPVWAWARPVPGQTFLSVRASWGPFRAEVAKECGDLGLFVTAPASSANPPLRVDLAEDGWVDFGQGVLPGELKLPVVNGLTYIQVFDRRDDATAVFAERLRSFLRNDGRWVETIQEFVDDRRDLVGDALGGFDRHHQVTDLSDVKPPSPPVLGLGFSGERYRRLREARGLSQAEVARLATALAPAAPIKDDQVATVEAGGRPRVQQLGSRLDTVFRADGITCLEPAPIPLVPGSQGVAQVNFPPYWVGPVWTTFTADGSHVISNVALQWGPWTKLLRVRSGTAATFRRSGVEGSPLVVRFPANWSIGAGMGAYRGAIDVNTGWFAVDDVARNTIFNQLSNAYLTAFGRTKEDFAGFLQRQIRRREGR